MTDPSAPKNQPLQENPIPEEIKENSSQKEYLIQKDEYYSRIVNEEDSLKTADVDAMNYLGDLGFLDFKKNKDVIKACKGDKTVAVSLLLKEQNKELKK